MTNNLYHEFRNHHSFDEVKTLIESLETRIWPELDLEKSPDSEQSIESILSSLSWSNLDRTGIRTMRERTITPYEYERPGVRIHVHPAFDSESLELEETIITLTAGHEMDKLNIGTEGKESARVVIEPDGRISESSI